MRIRLLLAVAFIDAATSAFAADIDIHDAIDIAANACPMNNGETDSPLHWQAERRGDTWHAWYGTSDAKLIQVEVDAHTGATTDCAMLVDSHP